MSVYPACRSKVAEWKLLEMFKKRAVIKKYLVITKGVPNPHEGIQQRIHGAVTQIVERVILSH